MPARAAAAKRYAQAAFQLAKAAGQFDTWQRDLGALATLVSDEQTVQLLTSPKLSLDSRTQAVSKVVPGISALAVNLTQVLMAKGRVRLLPEIATEYQLLLDAQRGIQHATVVSAVPLQPELRERLSRALSERVGKTVVLDSAVDPAITGGLIVRVGDEIIDGSTRSRLEGMRRLLVGRVG